MTPSATHTPSHHTTAPSTVDMDLLRQWIGRETATEDTLNVRHAHLMAATLGLPQDPLQIGSPLPPLWHWIYFLEGLPPTELGRDGHPARGGFLPPVPLSNRMWAGGSVHFHHTLPLGAAVQKRSRIVSVEHKQGRSGELVFVSVLHEIWHQHTLAVSETHDIVYKDPTPPTPSHLPHSGHPTNTAHVAIDSTVMPTAIRRTHSYMPDATMLFRYSALTFNGHRIHYDVDYCRQVEGYPNLVIHGPLNATQLAGFAQETMGKPLKQFRYRGLQPSILGHTLTLQAAPNPDASDALTVWVSLPNGAVSMRAEAAF